jgi:FkbM family methyltransferase
MKFLMRILRFPRQAIKGTQLQNNFIVIFAYRLLMSSLTGLRKDYRVSFRGMQLDAEGGDITILPTLIDETFEEKEIEWFLSRIREDRGNVLFIDVGANIGIYSLLALKNKAGITVASVEPDERNLVRLRRNVSMYLGTPKLTIFECAIGITDHELSGRSKRDFVHDKNGGTSRFSSLNESSEEQDLRQVDVLSLEDIMHSMSFEEFDDIIIKIDVEGFEPEVLKSGLVPILQSLPTILIEYTNSPKRLEMSGWDVELLSLLFQRYSNVLAIESTGVRHLKNPSDLNGYSKYEVLNLVFDNIA